MKTLRSFILGILIVSLAGCGNLPFLSQDQEPTQVIEQPTVALFTPEATATSGDATSPLTLQIWLPAEFGLDDEGTASEILHARLDEFAERHPGVRVDVRQKTTQGTGGLLNSLTTANAAAPLALPDLVALPRAMLESAVASELLRPLDDLLSEPGEDWYEYALQLGQVDGETYGLPFAGDALVLVYRPGVVGDPPTDWDAALQTEGPLAFPAADTQALFTLVQYQSLGGTLLNEEGGLALDAAFLGQVFDFYQRAQAAALMPFSLTQYESDAQSWLAFREKRAQMVVTWASQYFSDPPTDSAIAPLPTRGGIPYTLADGWVWAVSSPDPARYAISAELAEFLSQGEFVAQWAAAIGYLPTRTSALTAWPQETDQALISQVAPSADLMPTQTTLDKLGDSLAQATIEILKREADAATAAQDVIEEINQP